MSDDWLVECEGEPADWEKQEKAKTVYEKIKLNASGWLKLKRNSANTVGCEDGKFKPEDRYE